MSATATETWTTRRLLQWIPGFLENKGIDAPRVVAEMLLAHVLDCDRMKLYMEVDRPASDDELAKLRALVSRAGGQEPVQYLIGEAAFYFRSFKVGPATLIPQPCTETLVDHVLERLRDHEAPVIADIGTGSGCIGVSLAAQLKTATVLATDVVPDAIELARANAVRFGVEDRVELVVGETLAPLADRTFDAICSNPPYIPAGELEQMDESVRGHVPESAWFGGPDGLDVIRPIIAGAGPRLAAGGCLAVEIADSQRDAVLALATEAGLPEAEVLKDQEGYWRVLVTGSPAGTRGSSPPEAASP
jgi:release factor glutamine methyltransferase